MSDGPDMAPVKSSNVRAIGYDANAKELHVDFDSGRYIYGGVSPQAHAELMKAPSVGKHLAMKVKGKFTHRRPA